MKYIRRSVSLPRQVWGGVWAGLGAARAWPALGLVPAGLLVVGLWSAVARAQGPQAIPPAARLAAPAAPLAAAAIAAPQAAPTAARRPRHLSLFELEEGLPLLVVDYPWKVHAKTSIEVQLVPSGAEPGRIEPFLFRHRFFHGGVLVAAYECLDEAARSPASITFTEDETDWEIVGGRNDLGRPAIRVLRRYSAEDRRSLGGDPGALAVFLFLEHWAVRPDRLHLELPARDFAGPGTLHVWFLRGERVLWTETLAWPGRKAPAALPAGPETRGADAERPNVGERGAQEFLQGGSHARQSMDRLRG